MTSWSLWWLEVPRYHLAHDFDLLRMSQTLFEWIVAAVLFLSELKVLMAILTIGLIYYYLVLPVNWTKDLSDIGYESLTKNRRRGVRKRDLVNEIRKMRSVGEIPPVYPNGWIPIVEATDIQREEPRYVSALGEHFAVFRTESGEICVLDAYCPHLGANIALGGVVKGDCIECPFHKWQFSGKDGKCTAIPYADKVPETAKIKKWQSCEINSFVFVWYHAENSEPTWNVDPIPQIHSGEWIYRGRNEFYVNAHIQEIPENGCDVAHLNAIHADCVLLGSEQHNEIINKLFNMIFNHKWNATWERNPEPGRAHIANMSLIHTFQLFHKIPFMQLNVNVKQIGPSYVELMINSSLGSMVFVQSVTPVEPLLQRVIHRIYCPPHLALFASFTMMAESIMFQRDVMIWNHKKYEHKPFLVKGDGKVVAYRRWYSQFYSENSVVFSFRRETTTW